MVNKIIADYLKTNRRLVIPQFGAFIHKEGETAIVFVPFLKKDDGVLIQQLGSLYGFDTAEAQGVIDEYIAEIKESIASRGAFIIEGVGRLVPDSNGVYYLEQKTVASAFARQTPATPAGTVRTAPAVQEQAPVRQSPTQRPAAPTAPVSGSAARPAMPRPQPAPQPSSYPQEESRRSAPIPPSQRPGASQPAPRPYNPAAQATVAPAQPGRAARPVPPAPDPSRRPTMYPETADQQQSFRQPRPAAPHPGRRPAPGNRQPNPGKRVPRTKTDGFIIIAIIAAVVALAAILFGISVNRGVEIEPIVLPPAKQTDTTIVQQAE